MSPIDLLAVDDIGDDNRSKNSANSTVSQFIRKIMPSDSWTGNTAPSNDANADTYIDVGKARNQELVMNNMLFDAVPFNGDTDVSIYTQTTSLRHFIDMNIDIPVNRSGSNLSNLSPIGNVSSKGPFDEDEDDDSDDDLDRILGSLKAQPKSEGNWRRIKNKSMTGRKTKTSELLNTTLPTLLDTGSLIDVEEEDVAANTLGECLFEPCNTVSSPSLDGSDMPESSQLPKVKRALSSPTGYDIEVVQKDDEFEKKRGSRPTWWIAFLLFLILTTAVMIGTLAPSSGIFRKPKVAATSNQAQGFENPSNSTAGPIIIDPPNPKPPSLRPTSSPSPPRTNNRFEENRLSSRLPQIRLDMGPMVGHTTHDSVVLWAHYLKPAMYLFDDNYKLEVFLYDSQGWLRTVDAPEPERERNNAVFVTITNLEPLTVYRFEMRIMGQIVGNGSFRTAPSPDNSEGHVFEYLLASCMDKSEHPIQSVWGAIPDIQLDGTRDYPDFAVLAGDTIYLQDGIDVDDVWGVDFDQYWYKSQQQRTDPHFSDFVGNTPIYSTWNNHDYGGDTATKDQIGKDESLRAWNSLWPNPDSPGNNQDGTSNGIYYSFYWGDVHYIVTDDHWNRDSLTKSRWGDEQTRWIRSELVYSTGTFKVIVVGSDILDRNWRSDLENIGAILTEESIDGVLFHSGDIHRNEYKKRNDVSFPYPVHQITSSGIAKVWRKPFAKILVDTTAADPLMTVRFFGATSTEDESVWTNDPELICDTLIEGNRGGEHSCTQTIRLGELKISE